MDTTSSPLLPQDRQQLLNLTQAELELLPGFLDLLQQEQNALCENRVDLLPQLVSDKAELARQLQTHVDERVMFSSERGLPHALPHAESAFASDPELGPMFVRLHAMARQAAQLNDSNGEQINTLMRHNYQALNVLNQAADRPQVYDRAGHTRSVTGSGRQLGSA